MSRFCAILLVLSIGSSSLLMSRQARLDFGRWKNYTDMKEARAIAMWRDSLWVATSGGLYVSTSIPPSFTTFTNSDGLSSNDLTALTLDQQGRVWVGTSDGFINMYDPRVRIWKEIRSIKESPRVQKGIRTFLVKGDTLFVGTDFGIVVFRPSRLEFGDTYANFGFATQARVNGILVHKNTLWAATDLGVASAPLTSPNLSSPSSWTRYEIVEGLPSRLSNAIIAFRDTVVVGTSSGMAFFRGTSFSPVVSTVGMNITDLHARGEGLVILSMDGAAFRLSTLVSLAGSPQLLANNQEGAARRIAVQSNPSTIWVATSFRGAATWDGSRWRYVTPNGPESNLFTSLAIDSAGRLWAASGHSARGRGFYRFDPSRPEAEQWKNYLLSEYPLMRSNDYYKVSTGTGSSVWVSSWGFGLLEIKGDQIVRRLDHTTTPSLAGSVPADPAYVVTGGVASDSRGEAWVVNRTAVTGNHLVQLRSNGTARYFSSPSQGLFTNIVVDGNNTKWLANSEPTNRPTTGLYYFNEDTIVSGTRSTGGWGWMMVGDGLPSTSTNVILSLAIDKDGDVCVGTENGLLLINEPRSPKATNSTVSVFPLRGQVIQAIAVDALDNKWVGTKEGVMVVNPDGTQLLAHYSVLTTGGKLIDDDIRALAIDQRRGVVYIGTEKGLSSLEILPVKTERTLSSLEIAPNPYHLPAASHLTVRNLMEESSVKVLSVDGRVIREFRAQGGGRAFWDGKDEQGAYVASGVYFIVAYAENGNEVGTAKVAVVRK